MHRLRSLPILPLAALVCVVLAAAPVAGAEGVLGDWTMELEFNGRAVASTLAFWEEDGVLRGSWTGQRGTSDLVEVRFEDGTLSFARDLNIQGNDIRMSFEGTVNGDLMVGELQTPRGAVPVQAERATAAAEATAGDGSNEDDPPQVSELASAEAEEFLGNWALQMSFQGAAVQMDIDFRDVDGKVAATLYSSQGDQAITDITRGAEALTLAFDSDFGRLVMTARLEEQLLKGTFGDVGGQFSTNFSGSRSAARDSTDDGGGSRRRSGRPMTDLAVDGGQVQIYYANPTTETAAYDLLATATDGQVIAFLDHAAIKLMTDVDLRFGDLTVAQGNVSDNYPGAYGLWLKRAGESWHLVFNQEADIWGTMHSATADVGEVELSHDQIDEDSEMVETLTVELVKEGDGGVVSLAWGSHRWQVPFSVALASN